METAAGSDGLEDVDRRAGGHQIAGGGGEGGHVGGFAVGGQGFGARPLFEHHDDVWAELGGSGIGVDRGAVGRA